MNIGNVIYRLRTENNMFQKELCYGLCSEATLSRIEHGKDRFHRLLFDALIQRLGRSPDKYEYRTGKNEQEILDIRKKITDAYEKDNQQEAFHELTILSHILKDNDTINHQFIAKMRILLSDMGINSCKKLSKEEAIKEWLLALRITAPSITIGDLNSYYLSLEELRIYFLIGIRFLEYHDTNVSIQIFQEILHYLEVRYFDKEEKVKLYPQVAYQLGLAYEEVGEYEKLLCICKNAILLLVENFCIYFLPELLHLQSFAMQKLSKNTDEKYINSEDIDYVKTKKQAECLDEIIQEYSNHSDIKNRHFMHDRVKRVYLIQEIVKRQRKLGNLTQEKFSETICTVEHMSRIETGEKTPNTKNYHLIMEKLGQSKERYQASIFTEDYEVLEKDRILSFLLAKHQFEKAETLFLEIDTTISKEIPQNQQFLILTKAIIDHRLHRISTKEKLEQCEKALKYTIPSYKRDNLDLVDVIFSINEIALIGNIASAYKELGDLQSATNLLEKMLESYKRLKTGIKYHTGNYIFLLTQYASNLGLLGHYNKAIAEHKEVLRLCVLYGYSDHIGASIYGIAWNLLKIDKKSKKTCKRLCKQAYAIWELMQVDFYRDWMKDKYLEIFNEHINN